jgi:hypothetical protein
VYTSSVAIAYFRPLRGLEGAGEGGKLWPSKSSFEKAFPMPLELPDGPPGGGAELDIFWVDVYSVMPIQDAASRTWSPGMSDKVAVQRCNMRRVCAQTTSSREDPATGIGAGKAVKMYSKVDEL